MMATDRYGSGPGFWNYVLGPSDIAGVNKLRARCLRDRPDALEETTALEASDE